MNERGCVFFGDEVLTVQCAELAIGAGLDVVALVSRSRHAESWGRSRGVPVLDGRADLADTLSEIDFDVLFSIAYLRLIPDDVLEMSDVAVNFHDGPLPTFAGLNVTNWALISGEREHAITWHLIGSGIDDGDVLATHVFPIQPDDTAFSLNARCYETALATFPEIAAAVASGELRGVPQPDAGRRVFLRHERPAAATIVRSGTPAVDVAQLARGLDVGPRQRRQLGALRLVLDDAVYLLDGVGHVPPDPGRIPGQVSLDRGLRITTVDGDLSIDVVRDVTGRELPMAELAERHGLGDGVWMPEPSPALVAALDRYDPAISRNEAGAIVRLGSWEPTPLATLAGADVSGSVAIPDTDGSESTHRRRIGRPDGCTAEMAVGAVAAWLARRSGRDRVVFELVTEPLVEVLDALSPLANPPLVAVDVHPDATAESLAADVAAERARAERDGVWLADVVARDPDLRADPPTRPDVGVSFGGSGRTATAPVQLQVGDGEIDLVVDAACWSASEADRFASEIETLVSRACADPTIRIRRVEFVSEVDRTLLAELNATAAPHDESVLIDELFRECARTRPSAPALSFGDEQLTYARLAAEVSSFAATLRDAGAARGSRVGIALPRGVEMVVAVLATLECGAAYVPLDPSYPLDRLRFMVDDADLTVLAAVDTDAVRLGATGLPVVRPSIGLTATADDAQPTDLARRGCDLAYVIYTSGSTGKPKGVMLEHRQVSNFFAAMDEVIDHDEPGVWLAVTSLSFDISVLEVLWTLTRGFHVVLAPDTSTTDEELLIDEPGCVGPPTFSLFHFAASEANETDGYRLLLAGARFADEHGFEAVWVPERHFHEFGGIYPNPAVLGAAVAAITERVHVRAGSCVVPLHHPARVAEEWAVVDNISGGRVGIAAAAGWQPDDFVLRPDSYGDSKQVMLESLDTIGRLWRGERVTMEGPRGPVAVRTLPRPIQPDLPVWITSAGNVETFEIAGRTRRNVLTHLLGQSIEQVEEKINAYRTAWREAGHDGEGHVTLMLHTFLGEDGDHARATASPHLREYLRSATGLLKDVASSFPTLRGAGDDADALFASLDDEEMDQLLDMAVARYIGTSGLFGTVDDAMTMVERVAQAGADEVACLVDFGVATDDVIASLPLIGRLKDRAEEVLDRTVGREARTTPVQARSDETVARLVDRHGCTHLQCTPSMAAMLVADPHDRGALRSICHLLVGGEMLPTALADELRSLIPGRFTNMYGPTETTIWSLTHEIHDVGSGSVPIGRPIANTTIAVLDELGEPVPVGSYGELHIGGAGVARGYHDRPELTAERFVDRKALGRMYATGDVVRVLPSGVIEFGGRADFQVKIRGHRVELGEIETQLDRHPDVVQSVVSASPSDTGVRLAAHVLLRPGVELDPAALRAHLVEHVPEIMVPEAWMAVAELPLTPNGKIDRRALPTPAAIVGPERMSAPAADDRERLVAGVWEAALGRPVGRDDNFFDVGGHSLLAVKVFRQVVDRTGRELALTDVFRHPTVRAFAAHLAALDASGPVGAESAGRDTGTDRGARRRLARQRRGGG